MVRGHIYNHSNIMTIFTHSIYCIKGLNFMYYVPFFILSMIILPSWALDQDSDNHFSQQQSFGGSTLHALPTKSGVATQKSIASQAREEQSVVQALSVTVIPEKAIYSIGDTVEIFWVGTQQNDRVKIEMWRNGKYVKTVADNFTGASRYKYIWDKGDEGDDISYVVTINANTFTVPLLHPGKINSIDWSNDDVEILTVGSDSTYCIYEYTRNQILINRQGVARGSERGFIKNASFHPQDKTIATISLQYPSDSRVVIGLMSTQLGLGWRFVDYNSLITTSTDYLPIDFSPDGQYIISGAGNVCRKYRYEFIPDTVFIVNGDSIKGAMSRLYNVSSFNAPPFLDGRNIRDVKYTPYGDSLIMVGSATGRIGIPELMSPIEMATLLNVVDGGILNDALDIGDRNLASVAWNNSGTYCVSSAMHRRDSQIIIRNNSLQLDKFLIGATGVVSQVDWSKDGKFITSVDGDGYLVLWNENGELLKKHRIGIPLTAVKFSNDSRKIAIGDNAGNLYIIDNIPLFATGTSHPSMTASTSLFDVAMPEWKTENTNIDFGGVYTDETQDGTITIENTGKVPLIVDAISDIPSGFSWIDKPTPPIIIQTGEPKNFLIRFAPRNIQSYSGTLTMIAKIAKTQQIQFKLSGNGIDPAPVISSNVPIPIPATACKKVSAQVKISKSGRNRLEISDITVDKPFSYEGQKRLSIDQEETLTIWYDPNQGNQSGTLTIRSNAKNGDLRVNLVPNKQTVLYSFTQSIINLGEVCLDGKDIIDVTLKQDGTFNPTIRIEGDVNGVVPQQLLSSGDITFSLPLQFDTPGTFTKTITAKNNECEDYSENITITGYAGTPKLTIVDPPHDTLRSDAEEEIVDTIIIKNEGDIAATLTMDATQFSPFTLKNSVPNSLKKDESVAIIVSYIPKEEGEIIADKSLLFLHHCDVKPLEIPLRGESYRDDPEIVSEDINFGDQLVGYESAPRNLIIRNNSNKKAMFTANVKESSSAIGISYLPKLEINARESIAIPVVFKPEQKGVFSAGIDLRRDGNSTKTRVRAIGTGIERDSLRDKLITLLLENRNIKGKKIAAKDIIDIELRALSNEIDSALAAFNNAEYFPYSIDILWNPRLLALANIDEEMTEFKNGSGVTIKGKISRDMNKTGAFSTVKKLRFEVLWGEIHTKDSIAIGSIHIDTTDITSAIQARLWTPASEVVYLDYDPTCVSGFVRGATYREDLEIITIPNPSLGITSVYLSEIAARDHSKLEIYSHYGHKVHELSFVGNTIDIDMSHYSSGQYTVIAKTPRGIARTMVILIK
jgi:WD40 repeat protein